MEWSNANGNGGKSDIEVRYTTRRVRRGGIGVKKIVNAI